MEFLDRCDNSLYFAGFSFVDLVLVVNALDRLVGGNLDDIQTINLLKFLSLSKGCTSHAGQLVV